MVVIVWQLYLLLPVQSVHITTKVVSSNRAHGKVYLIQHYVIKFCQWLTTGRLFSPGTPISLINKTDRHDITEILLKVALNTLTLTLLWKPAVQTSFYILKQWLTCSWIFTVSLVWTTNFLCSVYLCFAWKIHCL